MADDHCRCGGDMPGRCPGPAFCPMEASPAPICERCDRDDMDSIEDRGNGLMLCDECASEWAEEYAERVADVEHNMDLRAAAAARLKETGHARQP